MDLAAPGNNGISGDPGVHVVTGPSGAQCSYAIPKDQYTDCRFLATGTEGTLASAVDNRGSKRVAIKRLDVRELHSLRSALREIKILKRMKHENITDLLDCMVTGSMDEVYLVQTLMDTDLERLIRSVPMTDDHVSYFVYQCLQGLKYIHSGNIVHRDLKPKNLLVNAKCLLKIADFGWATVDPSRRNQTVPPSLLMTPAGDKWYCPPDKLMGAINYTRAFDMWSIGCILSEMYTETRLPLFDGPGGMHQMERILAILGSPTEDDLKVFDNEEARVALRTWPQRYRQPWWNVLPRAPLKTHSFLEKVLVFNPCKRITAEEALDDPYLTKYRDPAKELVCPVSLTIKEMDFGSATKEQLTQMVAEEAVGFIEV